MAALNLGQIEQNNLLPSSQISVVNKHKLSQK